MPARDYSIRKYVHLVDLLLYRWEKKEGGEINEREALASFDEESKAGLFKQLKAFDIALEKREVSLLVLIFPLFLNLDDYPFREIHLEIGEFLTAEHIAFIDFLRDFSGKEDDQYWITLDDQHPNEIAHQVFFERVSAYVDKYLGAG